MKLNETVMIRNYLQILKENEEEARFDKEKMATIQDIAAKHSNEISYTQMLGVLDIPFERSSTVDDDRVASFIREIDNDNIDLYDDTGTAMQVIKQLDSFGIDKLTSEQKKVFIKLTGVGSNIERTPHINPEIVQKTILKGFKSGELTAAEWLMLVSNMRSSGGDTVRSAPWAVKDALTEVGVDVDSTLTHDQKRKSMRVGKKSSTRVPQTSEDSPAGKLKTGILRVINNSEVKSKEDIDRARQVLDNIFTARERAIIDATNAVNRKLGTEKYSAEQLINNPIISGPPVGRGTYPGLPPETQREIKKDFTEYTKYGVITWTSITKDQADVIQSGFAKSKQFLPKALAALGIDPQPDMD